MTEVTLCFRPMTVEDINQVMQVEQSVYEFPWSEQIFNDCIRVGYNCWIASTNEDVVGHAVISIAAGESHMLNLSIAKNHQGMGYGKLFVAHLVEVAQQQDAETMLLEVRPSNLQAISCYNSSGFNEIGSRKNYYPAAQGREDALLFARYIGTTSKTAKS